MNESFSYPRSSNFAKLTLFNDTRGVSYLPASLQKDGNGIGSWADIRKKERRR